MLGILPESYIEKVREFGGRHPQGDIVGFNSELEKALRENQPRLKFIHPVVIRDKRGMNISYTTGGGPCGISDEDWTLPIYANERRDGSYDIFIENKSKGNYATRDLAIKEMAKHIDFKGNFKRLEELSSKD